MIALSWFVGGGLGICSLLFRAQPNDPDQLCIMVEEMFDKRFTGGVALLLILPSNLVIAVMYIRIYRVILGSVSSVNVFSQYTMSRFTDD